MADDRRNEHGRFAAEYSADEFRDTVREYEPAGTSEVADAGGSTTQKADYRLRPLERGGDVDGMNVGRTLVWMLTENE